METDGGQKQKAENARQGFNDLIESAYRRMNRLNISEQRRLAAMDLALAAEKFVMMEHLAGLGDDQIEELIEKSEVLAESGDIDEVKKQILKIVLMAASRYLRRIGEGARAEMVVKGLVNLIEVKLGQPDYEF